AFVHSLPFASQSLPKRTALTAFAAGFSCADAMERATARARTKASGTNGFASCHILTCARCCAQLPLSNSVGVEMQLPRGAVKPLAFRQGDIRLLEND